MSDTSSFQQLLCQQKMFYFNETANYLNAIDDVTFSLIQMKITKCVVTFQNFGTWLSVLLLSNKNFDRNIRKCDTYQQGIFVKQGIFVLRNIIIFFYV